ncbi:MAG: hypothetical protein ABIS47_00830 [Acidimicrobiales bacterium]
MVRLGLAAGLALAGFGLAAGAASGVVILPDDGYVPLTPFRVLDTRSGTPLAPGETREVQVAGNLVEAIALNVTVDRPTASGFLTVFPTGETAPNASNLNFVANETIPNAVIAKVGVGGKISITNSAAGTTQVIIDIEGYFPTTSDYNPLKPVRILDTRSGTPLAPGETRDLQVTGSNGIPGDATAVVLNVTAVSPTTGGFLTVFPKGDALPDTSNLNFAPGQTIPNLVVATVGTDGKISIFNATGSTQVLVDVQGWFPFLSEYAALTPERILDTRSGVALGPGETRVLQVSGFGGVPDLIDAKAVVLNVTANQPTATSFLTVFPTGVTRPGASNLNFVPGQTIANTVISKLGDGGQVSIYNASGTTQVLVDVQGFFIRPTF